jgi:fructokinase
LTNPESDSSETPTNVLGTGDDRGRFRPLIFGEALFDYFPDGSRVLGGAPFNVAWHLRGFKADPLMVSGVGEDPDGREILDRMTSWGMDRSGVQVLPSRPTGRVTAHLESDGPRFDIEARQAYDAVAMEGLPQASELQRSTLLYHGSLGLREATSAQTLSHLKNILAVPVLVDVNLRDPWWDSQETQGHLRGAEWVKVNREEAGLLVGRTVGTESELMETCVSLRERLGIGNLVVTIGSEGALALTGDGVTRQTAQAIAQTVDTVGAGDAFSAVLALGMFGRWPISLTLRRASEFAGELCQIRGAIPPDPDLYQRYLRRWDHAT